jgi:hypothetical protein
LLISTFAVAALAAGVCACQSGSTASAGHKPVDSTSATGQAGSGSALATGATLSTGPGAYILQSMPTGTVSFLRARGHLEARVVLSGLTPGSAHDVAIDDPGSASQLVRFPALTADSTGRVSTTLTSLGTFSKLSPGSQFVIRLGSAATSGGDAMAQQAIAETGVLPTRPIPLAVFPFRAVTAGSLTQPAGRTTITYNAAAQTLTVSVTASGLTPGAHAAHIHLGSCQSQGAVKYMLADFVADAGGNIVNQTRVVTGVSSVPGPGAWYLNLHLGGMNQILANGSPTLYFRPMLCTNITSFAATGGSASAPAAPTPTTTTSPAMVMPTSTASSSPTPTMAPSSSPSPVYTSTPTSTPTTTPTAQPSTTWTATPTAQPTHW